MARDQRGDNERLLLKKMGVHMVQERGQPSIAYDCFDSYRVEVNFARPSNLSCCIVSYPSLYVPCFGLRETRDAVSSPRHVFAAHTAGGESSRELIYILPRV